MKLDTSKIFRYIQKFWRSPRRLITLIILAIMLIILGWINFELDDKRIKSRSQAILTDLTGGQVEIDEANFSLLSHTQIIGLRIYLPHLPRSNETLIFQADEITLEHSRRALLKLQYVPERIIADAAQIHLCYNLDSKELNSTQLDFAQKKDGSGKFRPTIILQNAQIKYSEIQNNQRSPAGQQSISGVFHPDKQNLQYYFQLFSGNTGLLQQLRCDGFYDQVNGRTQAALQLDMSKIDSGQLPDSLKNFHKMYMAATPTGQLTIICDYQKDYQEFTIRLANASYNLAVLDETLDFPLENVNAEILIKDNQAIANYIISDFGDDSRLRINGILESLNKDADFHLNIITENFYIPAQQWDDIAGDIGSVQATIEALLAMFDQKVREEIAVYSPTGRADARFSVSRSQDQPMETIGEIDLHNIKVNYQGFPYLLDSAQGQIKFDQEKIIIGPLTAQSGYASIKFNSQINHKPKQNWFIDVEFNDMPIDDKLYAAIDPAVQKIWDELGPAGKINGRFYFSQSFDENNQPVNTELLEITFNDCGITIKDYPLPVTEIFGQMKMDGKNLILSDIIATAANGQIKVQGQIDNFAEERPEIQAKLDFENINFNKNNALLVGLQDFQENLQLDARFAGSAEITSDYQGKSSAWQENLDLNINLNISQGNAKFQDWPLPLTDIQGQGQYQNGLFTFKNITANNDASLLQINGTLDEQNQIALIITANPLVFNQDLLELLKLDEYEIMGSSRANITINNRNPENQLNYRAIINPAGVQINLKNSDYSLNNINGQLTIDNEKIILENITSISDQGNITLNGQAMLPVNAGFDLDVKIENLVIDEKLLQSLNEIKPQTLFNKIQPIGTISLNGKTSLSLNPDDQSYQWKFNGNSQLNNIAVNSDLDIKEVSGQLQNLNLAYDSQDDSFGSQVLLQNISLKIDQKPVNNLRCQISFDNTSQQLNAVDIAGGFCSGRIYGQINVDLAEKQLTAKMNLLRGELAQIAATNQDKGIKGRVDGRMNLIKSWAQDDIDARGNFVVMLSQAEIGQLPVAAELLHFISLRLPRRGAFNEAYVRGYIIDNRTVLQDILLGGSAISLQGFGQLHNWPFANVNQQGEKNPQTIELTFATEPFKILKALPLFSSFWQTIQQEMMGIYVSGSLNDPKVSPVPLPNLLQALNTGILRRN